MEYKIIPNMQDGPMEDDETAIIFWSSGTTGIPKGIQHTVRYMKKILFWMNKNKDPFKDAYLTTTCHFHVGGFVSPLGIRNKNQSTFYTWLHGHLHVSNSCK